MKYKKLYSMVLAIILAGMLISGCAFKNNLPEGTDEDTVVKAAENLVEMINNADYQGVLQNADATLKTSITASQLNEGWQPYFSEIGVFVSVASIKFATVEENGLTYIRTVAICRHEKGTATYTFVFDSGMKLAGIFANFI